MASVRASALGSLRSQLCMMMMISWSVVAVVLLGCIVIAQRPPQSSSIELNVLINNKMLFSDSEKFVGNKNNK